MHLDENILKSLDLYLVKTMKQTFGTRLKTIVLFGSWARGSARPDSDFDILIILPDLPRDPLARNRITRLPLLPVLADLPGAISLVAKTPEEVAGNLSPLLLDICVDGLCLYGKPFFEFYRKKALKALKQSRLKRMRFGRDLVWQFPTMPKSSWSLTWEGFSDGKG
jgi:uncharacterized protein